MSEFKFIRGYSSAREIARKEADRLDEWADKYGRDTVLRGRTRGEIVAAARALGPDPDPAAMCEATGIDIWPTCTSCGFDRKHALVVVVGDKPDYDSSTAYLCIPCLRGCLEEAEALAERGDL